MPNIKDAIKTTAVVLVVLYVANQVSVTRSLVQKALTGY
jgi:hypothetical protein